MPLPVLGMFSLLDVLASLIALAALVGVSLVLVTLSVLAWVKKWRYVKWPASVLTFGFAVTVLLVGFGRLDLDFAQVITPATAAGEYVFKHNNGEIEVLTLSTNLVYRHELFESGAAYKTKREPLFSESNDWTYERRRIVMNRFSAFCKFDDPKQRVSPPMQFRDYTVWWSPPYKEMDACLVFFAERNYELRRVTNRESVQ